MIERVILQRLTKFIAYQCYLKGDLNKAIKKYKKLIEKDRALIYEKELCRYIEGGDIIEPLPNGFEDVKNPEEEPAEMLKLMALPFVFWSVVMLLIFAVMNAFLNQNTVYTDTMEWYWIFISALLPTIFTGIALRRVQYKFFKNDDAYELDLLRESKGENKFVNVVTFIAVILFLVFFVNLAAMGTRCYKDYLITDESEKLFVRDWQRYYYKDIDKVYYIKGRYNEYGDYIKRASYVLTFKDGRQLDTDLWDSLEDMRNTVFLIMHIENKEVIEVHSERDIK